MIELLCIVVGAVVGFIIGALVYRNNADKWKEQSEVLEAQFDAEVINASKEIKRLKAQLEQYASLKQSTTKE